LLYEIRSLKHIDAESTEEAIFWLKEYGCRARMIAGGTDLLGLIKDRVEAPEVLINIKLIPEMKRMVGDEERGLRIGAAIPLSEIERSDLVRTKYPILAAAARQVGTTQIRNMGTIGGNILQRPQCMYFRNPDFACHKKGKSRCYAIAGEHRDYYSILEYGKCVMAHPSDMAPALIALTAKAIIAGSNGEREIALEDLFLGPNDVRETSLRTDEILLGFRVPDPGSRNLQTFLKQRIRRSFDFALVNVAVAARIEEQICREIRIVMGGVAPFPYLKANVSELIEGKRLTGDIALKAAEALVAPARPLPMNRYKVDVAKNMVVRALASLSKEAGP